VRAFLFNLHTMKRILILLLICASFTAAGQNRFPSTDSLQNYTLRFVKNSAVESFTNLRMQNILIGLTQMVDTLRSAGYVDSIWIGTGDTLKYRIGSGVFVIGKVSSGGSTDSTIFATRFWTGQNYVPYTGATANVDLGSFGMTGSYFRSNSLLPTGREFLLYSNAGQGQLDLTDGTMSAFYGVSAITFSNGSNSMVISSTGAITDNRTYTLPNKSGTIALTSDVGTSTDNLDSVVQRGNTTNTRIVANGGVQTTDSVLVKDGSDNTLVTLNQFQFAGPGSNSGKITVSSSVSGEKVEVFKSLISFINIANHTTSIANTSGTQNNTVQLPDTSGTLAVGARLNNTTIITGANGIIDLGTIAGGGIDSIYRTPGVDSIYYTKGANTYAIKDSVGSGGGTGGVQWTGVDSLFGYEQARNGFHEIEEFNGVDVSNTTNQVLPGQKYGFTAASGNIIGYRDNDGTFGQRLGTLASTSAAPRVYRSGWTSVTTPALFLMLTNNVIVMNARIRITDLATSEENFVVRVGLESDPNSTTPSGGASFIYSLSGTVPSAAPASANWQTLTAETNTSRTYNENAGTPVAVGAGAYVLLTIEATNTAVKFYVNKTLIATHTSTLPLFPTTANLFPIVWLQKRAGTTPRTLDIDYITVDVKYNTPR